MITQEQSSELVGLIILAKVATTDYLRGDINFPEFNAAQDAMTDFIASITEKPK